MEKSLQYSILTFSFLICLAVVSVLTRSNTREGFLSDYKYKNGRTPASINLAYQKESSYVGNEIPNR